MLSSASLLNEGRRLAEESKAAGQDLEYNICCVIILVS
jgi:hypothetical protein